MTESTTKLRRLGQTAFEITPIGLGCMQFSGSGMAARLYPSLGQETVTEVVRTALRHGINWFDTAEMYGRGQSERALTSALRELDVAPGAVTVASKWTPLLRTSRSIGSTIDARLAALQGFPLDLHQIHMPRGSFSSIGRQVDAMAALCNADKIGAVGVSNFSARQMDAADRVLRSNGLRLTSNQVQINLLERSIESNGVLESARRLGVTLVAFSPLASGLLSGVFHDDPKRVEALPRVRRLLGRFNAKRLARVAPLIGELQRIGKGHGVSAAQVSLAWLTTFYGDTVVAIPGASKPAHAAESAGAMDVRLTDRELRRLGDLSQSCSR